MKKFFPKTISLKNSIFGVTYLYVNPYSVALGQI